MRNNERDEGDDETTQMLVQIELEDKTATDADLLEADKKSAAISTERTHRALLVYQLKNIEKKAFQDRCPGHNRVSSASQ